MAPMATPPVINAAAINPKTRFLSFRFFIASSSFFCLLMKYATVVPIFYFEKTMSYLGGSSTMPYRLDKSVETSHSLQLHSLLR